MPEQSKRLTEADLARLKALLDAHDRGGFYVEYWRLTGSEEGLLQANVATFSGYIGGIALSVNIDLQNDLKARYKGLFEISQDVAKSFYAAVETDVRAGGTGHLTDLAAIDSAKKAWEDLVLSRFFPGNPIDAFIHAIHGDFSRLDEIVSPGSGYALAGYLAELYGWRYGKRASDFEGLAGYTTKMVEGPGGQRIKTILDPSGKTVFVESPHQYFQDVLPDIDQPDAQLPYSLSRFKEFDREFRVEADESHYPFGPEHELWRPLPPGIADRDRASQAAPTMPAPAPLPEPPPLPPWGEDFHELMQERGRHFLGLSPRQAMWTGDGDGDAAAQFASFDPDGASPVGVSLAEADADGEEPDDDGEPDGQPLAKLDRSLDGIARQLGEIIAGLDAQLALRRRRAREIVRDVEAWFEREANKPRNSSWRYDFRRTYTPPGPVPPM